MESCEVLRGFCDPGHTPPEFWNKLVHVWEGQSWCFLRGRDVLGNGVARVLCVCLSSSWEMRSSDLRGPQLRVSHMTEQ